MYTNRKIFIFKCVIAICLMYICVHLLTNASTRQVIRSMQESGRNFANMDQGAQVQDESAQVQEVVQGQQNDLETSPESPLASDTSSFNEIPQEPTVFDKIKEITQCLDRPMVRKTYQRGDYWVLMNYVSADRTFKCEESVTYTAHADFSFMDNLIPLVERWNGPISIAMHAPGSDFKWTLDTIGYLRDCTVPQVRDFVTFHVYFSTKHVPKKVPKADKILQTPYNCSIPPPFETIPSKEMYKAQKKLLYPINVGRNIAREAAQTYYILPSDIELYPSPNLIPQFLDMIAANKGPLLSKNPKIFPITLFEVNQQQAVPDTKTQLQEMLANKTAVPFHKNVCPFCHNIPHAIEWMKAKESPGIHVFHVGKRNGKFIHWEPIFIGTHNDPLYDERLSWEGKSDKMTQGYALCVLNYDLMILDNAFLVHKPGIKKLVQDKRRAMLAYKTNRLISQIIFPELKILYGEKKGCAV